jgi:hypothetical protein
MEEIFRIIIFCFPNKPTEQINICKRGKILRKTEKIHVKLNPKSLYQINPITFHSTIVESQLIKLLFYLGHCQYFSH